MYVGPHVLTFFEATSALTLHNAIAVALSGAATSVSSGVASSVLYGYSVLDGVYNGLDRKSKSLNSLIYFPFREG